MLGKPSVTELHPRSCPLSLDYIAALHVPTGASQPALLFTILVLLSGGEVKCRRHGLLRHPLNKDEDLSLDLQL